MEKTSTKERILYAALDLISERGYDGVGVDLLAEKAGLKGPSLYRHYKGKEKIFDSLIDMVEKRYEEGFRDTSETCPKSMDELINNAMKSVRFTVEDEIIRKTRRILAMEQFRSERLAEITSRYHLENLQHVYAGFFDEMMRKGLLIEDDPEYMALEFVAPVSLMIHICDRQPERKAEMVEKIQNHFKHFAKIYGKERG